ELEQKFIRDRPLGKVRAPVLAAHLAELTWPVRQNERPALIEQRCIVGMVRSIITAADEPASRELIVAGRIEAHGLLETQRLVPPAPDPFGPSDEGVINRTLQRTPPVSGVDAEEAGREATDIGAAYDPRRVVAPRVRSAQVDVAVFGDVLIRAKVPDVAQIAA